MSTSARLKSKGTSSVRRDGETAEERNRRREEKVQRVGAHRAQILQKVNAQKERKVSTVREEFICPIEYDNTLPELPVEAKYMAYPFDEDLLTAYDVLHGVSTELTVPHVLHAEPGLGLRLNMVDPAAFIAPPASSEMLDPMDEYITSSDFAKPASRTAKRDASAAATPNVEWMVRPNLMHLDLYNSVYKHADTAETMKSGAMRAQAAREALLSGARRIRIDAGFAAVSGAAELKHPTNSNLRAERVWQVLPDPDRTAVHYVHATFDGDPDDTEDRRLRGDPTLTANAKRVRLDHAVIRMPTDHPVAAREGSVVAQFLLPGPEDVPSLIASSTAAAIDSGAASASSLSTAASGDPLLHLSAIRDYHLVAEELGNAGTSGSRTAAAAKPGRNMQRMGGEEYLVLFWDDQNAVVTFAPVRARATMTAIQAHASAASSSSSSSSAAGEAGGSGGVITAVIARRPLLPEEVDAAELGRASVDSEDPAARRAAILAARRKARVAAASTATLAAASRGATAVASSNSSSSSFAAPSAEAGDSSVLESEDEKL